MSTQPHMQEARERFKKIGEGHVVRCVVFLQCSEIESDCFQIFQSQFGNPQISPFNFLSCSACWSKKQDAGMETSHAKRIFSDNVTCFGKNKSCRSHLQQCFIKALRFLLAWLLCFYTENPRIFFWKAIFATSPIVPAVTIHTLPWKMRVETCPLSLVWHPPYTADTSSHCHVAFRDFNNWLNRMTAQPPQSWKESPCKVETWRRCKSSSAGLDHVESFQANRNC